MEQVCCKVFGLLLCAVLVALPCDGSNANPASRTGRIATEWNSNAGFDSKVPRSISVRNFGQTLEAKELEPPPKNHYGVNANIAFAKKLSVETFTGVNRYATAGRTARDEHITDGKSLETDTIVYTIRRNVDKLGPKATTINSEGNDDSTIKGKTVKSRAIDNVLTDWDQVKPRSSEKVLADILSPVTADGKNIKTNEKVLQETTKKDVNSGNIQGLGVYTEMLATLGNSTADNKQTKSFVNNNKIRSSKDESQVHTVLVNVDRKEKGLSLRTTDIQKSNKHGNRVKRNSNNNDEYKMIDSESEEMRNKNLANEKYFNNMTAKIACDRSLSVVIKKGKIFPNGSLLSLDDTHMLYPPDYFWEEPKDDNDTEVRGCPCLLRNCIRKCCPEGEALTSNTKCKPSNLTLLHPFSPDFLDENNNPVKNDDVYRLYGQPCLRGGYILDPAEKAEDQFMLLLTGMLISPTEGNFTVAEYCIEAFEEQNAILPLLCFPDEIFDYPMEDTSSAIYVLYPIGLIISVPFLFATFLVYAVISELRNLHGKSLMSHVISLLTAYVFLAIVQLQGARPPSAFCKLCAFVIFFAFLASFFWLNVMCFDIWWTFCGVRYLRGSAKERERKKFLMYSSYAWGAPLIMLVVCLSMELTPAVSSTYITPEFGDNKCWFKTRQAVLAYFYGPIGVLLLCNSIFFTATAFKIIALKRETRMLKERENRRHDDKENRQRLNLYLKLFIVMGVNWIMEVISWAVGGPEYLWYVTDLGNILQGVLIFIIFVCKQRVRRILVRKFCPHYANRSGSTFHSSTKSQPTTSHSTSYSYTTTTSVSNHEQFHMKPTETFHTSNMP